MIDFSKIGSGNTSDTALPPREIFNALPSKDQKYQYPRDVQSQVWSKWLERKEEHNLIIKMNTGSGKTVVGLLILKSCLNEKKGPAVYICPDSFLVEQVVGTAQEMGITVTIDPRDHNFLCGNAILVINIYKLVNGLSVFGVGDVEPKISFHSVIIDDAHSCLNTIESQFTLKIPARTDDSVYAQIYALIKDELKEQNTVKALEIENLDPTAYMQLPYWVWQKKLTEITSILVSNASSEQDGLLFNFPLIKSNLKQCRCVVSSNEIEISPHGIPLQVIPSLEAASRTVFMTATLSNNSILASHFGLEQEDFKLDIVPESAGDVGDRMILIPQVLNPKINDTEIKQYCSKRSKEFNVVVIVPSKYRADFWSDVADQTLDASGLDKGVEELTSGHLGLTVIINKYDGIDLPDDACRLLILDGLPDVRRKIDQIEQNILSGSDREITLAIQKIEQGMGRGVRSNDDYCAIFLMGGLLTSKLYSPEALDNFSPATKAQMELSTQVSKQLNISKIDEITEVLDLFLNRDSGWLTASKGTLASIKYSEESEIDNYILSLRKAYDLANLNRYQNAVSVINNLINTTKTKKERGYLKQICAEYINCYDPVEAQKMQMSAIGENSRVLKPIEGIQYHKIKNGFEQASNCMSYLAETEFDANQVILEINAILDDLTFKPNSSNRFEEAIKKIAFYIGFEAQRPENDYDKGPDDLWSMGDLNYLVIECKNESTTDTISKGYCNQLNGSIEWFTNTYDNTCNCTPVLIHPSRVFEHASSPNANIRIMDQTCLDKLKESIRGFFRAICTKNELRDVNKIQQQLTQHKLRRIDIVQNYTVGHYVR